MNGREVGSPVAQDLVGRGVRAERPAYRDDRCCSHPNTRIGIFSVDWFQIETKFYFGNHWMENRDFHVTIVQWKYVQQLFTASMRGIEIQKAIQGKSVFIKLL